MSASKDRMISAETLGSALSVLSRLFWLGVVALMAQVFGDLIAGQPVAPVRTGLWLLVLWGLRAALDMKAQELRAHAADARIDALRPEIVTLEAQAATPSALGDAGSIAALAAEKLESMRPALLRYRPACLRVMVLPPMILCIAAWQSCVSPSCRQRCWNSSRPSAWRWLRSGWVLLVVRTVLGPDDFAVYGQLPRASQRALDAFDCAASARK